MLISARARGYLCNHIMSVFSGSLFMKSRKREKGERGSELYMEQGELCKHIECVEGKGFFAKKSLQFLHNKNETEMKKSITLNTPFPLKLFQKVIKVILLSLPFSRLIYPILLPLALCPSGASFERPYQPFLWQLFSYPNIEISGASVYGSDIQVLEYSWVMLKLSW